MITIAIDGPFTIKTDANPLKPGKLVYRAFDDDGSPMYIGRDSLDELVDFLRSNYTWRYRQFYEAAVLGP